MQAVKTLPASYAEIDSIDLAENKRLALGLTLAAFLLFFFFVLFFTAWAAMLRYNVEEGEMELHLTSDHLWWALVVAVAVVVLVVIVHEFVHALFFRIFTGEWAKLGVKGWYAYAAAPDWYIPRNLHIVTLLAPLVIISLTGMIVMLFVPLALLWGVLLFLVVNAAGAIGDIVTAGWLLTKPRDAYVNDYGDGWAVYTAQ